MRVSIESGFSLLLLISGLLTGSAFMLMHILVSGKPLNMTAFMVYLMLLSTYSLYVSQMRLSALSLEGRHRLWVLITLLLVYVVLFILYEPIFEHSALKIGLLQSLVFLACAITFQMLSKCRRN
jgi:hypothetical protein